MKKKLLEALYIYLVDYILVVNGKLHLYVGFF